MKANSTWKLFSEGCPLATYCLQNKNKKNQGERDRYLSTWEYSKTRDNFSDGFKFKNNYFETEMLRGGEITSQSIHKE